MRGSGVEAAWGRRGSGVQLFRQRGGGVQLRGVGVEDAPER